MWAGRGAKLAGPRPAGAGGCASARKRGAPRAAWARHPTRARSGAAHRLAHLDKVLPAVLLQHLRGVGVGRGGRGGGAGCVRVSGRGAKLAGPRPAGAGGCASARKRGAPRAAWARHPTRARSGAAHRLAHLDKVLPAVLLQHLRGVGVGVGKGGRGGGRAREPTRKPPPPRAPGHFSSWAGSTFVRLSGAMEQVGGGRPGQRAGPESATGQTSEPAAPCAHTLLPFAGRGRARRWPGAAGSGAQRERRR